MGQSEESQGGGVTLDLAKLTPAPWFVNPRTGVLCHGDINDDSENYPLDNPWDDEFIALARSAFDVMMRRGWHAEYRDVSYAEESRVMAWVVGYEDIAEGHTIITAGSFPDPFTALVEADRWMSEREEKAKVSA